MDLIFSSGTLERKKEVLEAVLLTFFFISGTQLRTWLSRSYSLVCLHPLLETEARVSEMVSFDGIRFKGGMFVSYKSKALFVSMGKKCDAFIVCVRCAGSRRSGLVGFPIGGKAAY